MSAPATQIPLFFQPRPAQQAAWARRLSGQYDYYFKIWHRQLGKDTDDIQYALYDSYTNPGIQSAYVGPDNKWIRRNIWDKYLEGRKHWANYPPGILEVKDTQQQVKLLNNPPDLAEALIQFIGFKESESLVGSSYDRFFFSELSLYKRGALDFIVPIWDNKQAEGLTYLVNFNFTPRGINNIAADMLSAYTGTDDPEDWKGPDGLGRAFGRTYVDIMPADRSLKADGTRLYSDEQLEKMRQRFIRMHGSDAIFRQEFLCEFQAQNAGLVYPGVEQLRKDGRYTSLNINPKQPLYMALDISSKGKESDWTAALIYQYYNGQLFIYDYFEDNRMAVVECVQEVAKRPYWHLIHTVGLPWDADRSGSMSSPLVECREQFPGTTFRCLERTFVADGINRVRMLFPNMIVNKDTCSWPMECWESWEYKTIESLNDFSPKPRHDRFSHLGDCLRYVAEMIDQWPFISHGGRQKAVPTHYPEANFSAFGRQDAEDSWENMPVGMRPSKLSPMRNKPPSEYFEMDPETGMWLPKGTIAARTP